MKQRHFAAAVVSFLRANRDVIREVDFHGIRVYRLLVRNLSLLFYFIHHPHNTTFHTVRICIAMLRLQSQQALQAHRSLFHSPIRSPLCNPLQLSASRHFHNNTVQAPFCGPPSYDTINRRFSSQPNPAHFYAAKRSQEARERGDFADIHDATGVGPGDYDVLITDVTDKKLRTEFSELIGIEYLAKATEAEANKTFDIGKAIIFGPFRRTIFPCVVNHEDNAHWVFFLVDNSSPGTYLSQAVSMITCRENIWQLT
jgi:hypothetical protein